MPSSTNFRTSATITTTKNTLYQTGAHRTSSLQTKLLYSLINKLGLLSIFILHRIIEASSVDISYYIWLSRKRGVSEDEGSDDIPQVVLTLQANQFPQKRTTPNFVNDFFKCRC